MGRWLTSTTIGHSSNPRFSRFRKSGFKSRKSAIADHNPPVVDLPEKNPPPLPATLREDGSFSKPSDAAKEEYINKTIRSFVKTTGCQIKRESVERLFVGRRPFAVWHAAERLLLNREKGWCGFTTADGPAKVFERELSEWYDPHAVSEEEAHAIGEAASAIARAEVEAKLAEIEREQAAYAALEGKPFAL